MIVEAGLIAGYVVAWAVQKARRVAGRLDNEADAAIDAAMDRLDEVVTTRLAGHPVLDELAVAAAQEGQVSDLTKEQLELAVTAAARRDEAFGTAVTELLARLQAVEQASGRVIAGPGSTVFTGTAHAEAKDGGIAIGQAGRVEISRDGLDPSAPGRSSR